VPGSREDHSDESWTRWLPFVLALLVIALDRVTKLYIRGHLGELDSIQVIPGLFRIVHTENPGAAFGILAESNPMVRAVVLVGISSAVLIFVVAALLKRGSGASQWISRMALGLIRGGAIGNLYDRIFRGMVTDFVEIYNGGWSFPAFNVADSAITIGAVFLLFELIWPQRNRLAGHAVHPPTEP
jgi:signal peptidase II